MLTRPALWIVRRFRPVAASLLLAWLVASSVAAAEPALRDLNLRGLQIGAATTVVLDGDDLGPGPRLLLPFAARQQLQPGATDKRVTFEVVPDEGTIPGLYQLRLVTDGGVSLPLVIAVDRLPQRALAPVVEQLPIAVHGTVNGPTVVETRFPGKAGQTVTVEIDAQRLGSKLRPVVHLSVAGGRQIAWSWGQPAYFGDARLTARLPADGEYSIALHDSEYGPPGPAFFRMRVGDWPQVDRVFPLAVGLQQPAAIEYLGVNPVPRVELAAQAETGSVPLAWPGSGLWSGPRPFILVSPRTELVEQRPANEVQTLPEIPVGVSGRLGVPYEDDVYRVAVSPGLKLRLEVWAERGGSSVDAALVVRNAAGAVLARAEDGPASVDPVLDFTVPDNTRELLVSVVDALGRGQPQAVYRLTIESQPPDKSRGTFRLATPTARVSLPVGGRWIVPVYAERQGDSGPIELQAAPLPAGLALEGMVIPAGTEGTLVTASRADAPLEPSLLAWRGRGVDGHWRSAMIPGHPLERIQPWLAAEVGVVGIQGPAIGFSLDWRGLPTDAGLVPAGRLPLPVRLVRPAGNVPGGDGPVRLTLVTSQLAPLVNGQPDPNRTLRLERPIELAANVADGDLPLLLPADLPAPHYDIAVQAELLSPDKQRVLATAFTPVRRLPVRPSLVVQLAGAPRLAVEVDPQQGAMVPVTGKIERREGLTGDVVVAISGLPAGARADAVTVKDGATDFQVQLVLPANQPAGEWGGLKLVASANAPGQPGLRVTSRDVELILVTSVKGK